MTRYYNPQWCRWISADAYTDTKTGILGTNMYAYCHNNPVNLVDPSGMSPSGWGVLGVALLVGGAAAMMYERLGMDMEDIEAFWTGIDIDMLVSTANRVISMIEKGYTLRYFPDGGFHNFMQFVPPSQAYEYIAGVEDRLRPLIWAALGGVGIIAGSVVIPAIGMPVILSFAAEKLVDFGSKPFRLAPHALQGGATMIIDNVMNWITSGMTAELREWASKGLGFVISDDGAWTRWSSKGDFGYGVYPWIWVKR